MSLVLFTALYVSAFNFGKLELINQLCDRVNVFDKMRKPLHKVRTGTNYT